MQEDKPALVDCIDTWDASVHVVAKMVPAIDFKKDKMRQALSDGYVTATELADHLVSKGVPFRECHHVVGRIVGDCIAKKLKLDDLSVDDYREYHPDFGDDVLSWVDPEVAVERRNVPGGPARSQVQQAINTAKEELKNA
jgi:argininosuccinate lyase